MRVAQAAWFIDEDRRRSAGEIISMSSGLDRLDTSGDHVGSMLQSAAPINKSQKTKDPWT